MKSGIAVVVLMIVVISAALLYSSAYVVEEGQQVEFEIEQGPKGLQASNVTILR